MKKSSYNKENGAKHTVDFPHFRQIGKERKTCGIPQKSSFFRCRKTEQEKVVDAMGEELQEQLQNKILWESPFDVPLLGPIHISESVVMTWFIMAIIMVLVLILTRSFPENGRRSWKWQSHGSPISLWATWAKPESAMYRTSAR